MAEEKTSGENPRPEEPPRTAAAKDDKKAPDAQPKKSHWLLKTVIGVVLLAVIGLLLWHLLHKTKPAAPPQPPQVSITNAAQGDIGIYVNALGSVTPLATVSVSSQVTGQLTNVNFTEGQMVKAGDLLVQIDERPFQASLTAAEGQLERDGAMLDEARMDLTRYQAAVAQNAVPKQQAEDQQAVVHQDEGTVKFDQGQVDNAKVQLAYCHITSPISGRVGLRLVDPGNLVQGPSTNALAMLTQLQPITVIFDVAEDELPAIQHQLSIGNNMTVDAYDRAQAQKIATGTVLALDNMIDPTTGTVRLRSQFTNDDSALFPGQFVNVRLLVDTLKGKTLIPTVAIQRNAEAQFVYVLKSDQTLEMRNIKIDVTDGDTSAIEGVQPGETLVTDNFNRVQDKAKVTPRKPGDNGNDNGGGRGRRGGRNGSTNGGGGQ